MSNDNRVRLTLNSSLSSKFRDYMRSRNLRQSEAIEILLNLGLMAGSQVESMSVPFQSQSLSKPPVEAVVETVPESIKEAEVDLEPYEELLDGFTLD